VFDGAQHISLRSLPGMADRAVRLGSAGKTFSFTAWKARVVVGEGRVFQCQLFCNNPCSDEYNVEHTCLRVTYIYVKHV
jgi:aspartate/methionine/tyrosine aminotransferase